MSNILNQYDRNDIVILIGNSFGGDSILKAAASNLRTNHVVSLLATLDPISAGGVRGNFSSPPSNVKYFYNRWQQNTPWPVNYGDDGTISSNAYGSLSNDYHIQDQSSFNDGRDRGVTAIDIFFGLAKPWDTSTNKVWHESLPDDGAIENDLNKIIDGLIPQRPRLTVIPRDTYLNPRTQFSEGDQAILDCSQTFDPNPGDTIRYSITQVVEPDPTRPAVAQIAQQNDYSPYFTVSFGDNSFPGKPVRFVVRATDSTGKYMEQTVSLDVANLPPQVGPITGPDNTVRGFDNRFSVQFIDAGYYDTHTAKWGFGDGTATSYQSSTSPSTQTHLFVAKGTYSVVATVRDDDNGQTDSPTKVVSVLPAGLVPNPTNPALMDLLVGGSMGSDVITVQPGSAPGRVRVVIAGELDQEFTPTGDIKIAGQAGADSITVAAGLSRPVFVYGGDGADSIYVNGSSAASPVTVSGDAGDDVIRIATSGHNLNAIAGTCVVKGGSGSDQLIVYDDANTVGSTYWITPTFVQRNPRIDYDGVEGLQVIAGTGADSFKVQPSLNTYYYLNGNSPDPGKTYAKLGDYLELDTKTTFPTDPQGLDTSGRKLTITSRGNGYWDFTKTTHKRVQFESIEQFNHVDIVAAGTDAGTYSNPTVQVFDAETNELKFTLPAQMTYGVNYRNGIRVATGDMDNDGLPDVVVAPGRLMAPTIKVFNGAPIVGLTNYNREITSMQIPASQTYGASFIDGVQVAVGDVVGDGLNDVILAPSRGQSVVKVFQNSLVQPPVYSRWAAAGAVRSFRAFSAFPTFIGGATLATADFKGSGKQQIVVASGSGMRGLVQVFDVVASPASYSPIRQIYDPDSTSRGGLNVSIGDVNGDGTPDIIAGAGNAGNSWVRVYDGRITASNTPLYSFQAFTDASKSAPVRVVARDIDGDGRAEIFAAHGADGRNNYQVKRFRGLTAQLVDSYFAGNSDFNGGGVFLG
ncbi:MAG: FG-GAP-like repeat-containing protein [Planctomycetota bacterium]